MLWFLVMIQVGLLTWTVAGDMPSWTIVLVACMFLVSLATAIAGEVDR